MQALHWDYQDQLTEVELNGTGDRGYYNYDGSGQRVRKVVVKSGKRTERLYLGGVERYREYSTGGTIKLERWTVQIDDIAQVDTLTVDNSVAVTSPVPLIRYQYRDHLGSASLETNENGQVISYEEYHPFGTSAYRAAKSNTDLSLKRYRFTNKERDDETGLYYFGVRYYAAWLGRWTSSDPGDFVDGLNLYVYVRNNPVNGVDELGYETDPPPYTLLGTNSQGGNVYKDERYQEAYKLIQDNGNEYYTNSEGKYWFKHTSEDEWSELSESSVFELALAERFTIVNFAALNDELKTVFFREKVFKLRKDWNWKSVSEKGFFPKLGTGETTAGLHALGLGEKNSLWTSYFDQPPGEDVSMKGEENFIDIEKVKETNKVLSNPELVEEVKKTKVHPQMERGKKTWLSNNDKSTKPTAEHEGVIQGLVEPGEVYTKGQVEVHNFMSSWKMKLVTAYAVYKTSEALFYAGKETFNTGDSEPLVR